MTVKQPRWLTWTRWILAGAGLGALAYALAGALASPDLRWPYLRFLILSLAGHELILLPAALAAGYLIGRFLPRSARPAIRVAAFISAALIVVAMPGVLGYGRSPDLPSALPRNSLAGLAVFLGITWLAAAGYLLAQAWHTRRRPAKTP